MSSSAMNLGLYLKLRDSMAAFNSAMPKSTGPARAGQAATAAKTSRLIGNRMPTSSRKIAIDDHQSHGAHRQQCQSWKNFVQEKFTRPEKCPVNQHTTRGPAQEVREAVARRLNLRRQLRDGPPACHGWPRAAIKRKQRLLRLRSRRKGHD